MLVLEVVVVLYLALSPRPPQALDLGWDKLNHLAAFACMAVTAARGFPNRWWGIMGGLLLLGALIEVLQSLTPHRYAEWADLLSDGLGTVLGLALGLLLQRWLPPFESRPTSGGVRA